MSRRTLLGTRVFEAEGLPRLVSALQAAAASGTGAVARVALTTVQTSSLKIRAGRLVDLTLVYLDLPKRWGARSQGDGQAIRRYRGFPETPTISDLDLAERVSLLAQPAPGSCGSTRTCAPRRIVVIIFCQAARIERALAYVQ